MFQLARYAIKGVPLLCALNLAACGVQRAISANDARERYEQSSADYRACLAANSSDVRACEGKRLVMETNEREYLNLRHDNNSIEIRGR
jgi:hypothetical protein